VNEPITILITELDGNPPKRTWQELEDLVNRGAVVHLCASRGTRLLTGDKTKGPWPWSRLNGDYYRRAIDYFVPTGEWDGAGSGKHERYRGTRERLSRR